ncbi:signal recognition particle-docking protein FtsY [Candidatus Pacearchaeota archaeon CG_4_9_14_3_um_filter_31_7]|nr:MAG: signal recognition particle-docking protein FtsY [Candidatus Pacearchaeota archaeon CG1_02_31_27]PIN92168.1 MAG: signal recognition particle-docking protein FtsY [Candidatus Pacearchaeota archaeon CG10_big_fil_rev_8_21_14_0_10_31_59]PIZ79857.1 MAG: signal recognition particle-docking protein FtsY [Candidatus Pacearchaeota archaeon CG_4_10_14_0_2_um_filter_31_10]PJA70876.1 MAG: signal recognition particle-docking protein FtsY [Candidatus Pacearchaeota archaeon CG_4_9_14_3_um_filter_31_7]
MFDKLKDKLKKFFTKTEEKVDEIIEEKQEEIKEKFKEEKIDKREGKKRLKEEKKKERRDEKEEVVDEGGKEKKGFFEKLVSVKLDNDDFDEIFEELEVILLQNNIAVKVIDAIRENMKKDLVGISMKRKEFNNKVKESLKEAMKNLLMEPFDLIAQIKKEIKEKKPYVIVFFGINGSGKTTTIAKIADLLKKNDLSCIISASDTFRAAAIQQLEQHGENLGIKVIKHDYGGDPAAVAYDAIEHAKAKEIDVVLVDTAGRMHSNENLIKEMEKIIRVNKPDLKLFVAESITGNDAVNQAQIFNDKVGIDGSVLTKADVDEKGGTAVSIIYVTKKPILFLGVGQKYSDLEKFDPKKVIKGLGLE